jgi:hypothetical protein
MLKVFYEASRREAILKRDLEEEFPASSGNCGSVPAREGSEASNLRVWGAGQFCRLLTGERKTYKQQ